MTKLSSRINRAAMRISSVLKQRIYRKKILGHRLIFSINSGRSGSKYLADLLKTAKEVTSFHEPKPTMVGDYLQMIEHQPYKNSINRRTIKSICIKEKLLELPDYQVYSETNHMFIKTFFDVIIREFEHENLQVITLRRNLAHVLRSCMQCGYFSEKNKSWKLWMSSPNAVTAAIPCIDSDDKLDPYDLCIAYLIDIEARSIRFQNDYPWIKNHQLQLENLNNYENVEKLFENLKITPTEATKKMYYQKSNTKKEKKKKINQNIDLDYCKQRIEQYIEKAESLGILASRREAPRCTASVSVGMRGASIDGVQYPGD